eukprot:14286021-Alexandrium_andersonii.AAC.1
MLDHLQSGKKASSPGNPSIHSVGDHPLSGSLAGSTSRGVRVLAGDDAGTSWLQFGHQYVARHGDARRALFTPARSGCPIY